MQEKIYNEWNKPEWVQVEEREYIKLQEENEYMKKALEEIETSESVEEIKEIVRELNEQIN